MKASSRPKNRSVPHAIRMRSVERAGRLVLAGLLDSPLEGDGFELPVPREIGSISTFGEE
jgi:hypothetical protein